MKFPEKKLVIVPNAVLPERAGSTLHGRRHIENRERPESEWYTVY